MKTLIFFLLFAFTLAVAATTTDIDPDALQKRAKALTSLQIQEYEALAIKGNPEAQVIIALVRFREAAEARAKDLEKYWNKKQEALALYTKAAENNYAPAQYFLAEAYENVEIAGLDCEAVNKWLERAISLNYAPAMWYKGFLYETNRCVQRDYAKSLELYKRANSLGYYWASDRIGNLYSEGLGVTVDENEALKWYMIAANSGIASSQNSVGIRMSEGTGVKSNNKEAVKWFKKSAEQGDVFGACNLALHYAKGHGVAKSPLLSLKWMYISHSLDGLKCFPDDFIKFLKPSKATDNRAWKLAVAWLRRHPDLDNNFNEKPWMKERSK